jgi:hypothetical protein
MAESAGLLLIGVLLQVPLTILRGYAVAVLWAWFIVPLFGLPQLNIPYAIGLALTVSLVHPRVRPKSTQPPAEALGERIAESLILTGTALLIGWIVKGFL